MILITDTGGYVALVKFPYDETAVEIIRGIPGRHWAPTEKTWSIPREHLRLAARLFREAGFSVEIDTDDPKMTESTVSSSRPLVMLFGSLPERLRPPVYRALSKVLHPDVGGDTELMKQLNDAAGRHR